MRSSGAPDGTAALYLNKATTPLPNVSAVVDGDTVHFFEKRSKGHAGDDGWDLQKVDLGIALCHFELAAQSCGLQPVFTVCDPAIALPENTRYIASYRV